MTKNESLSKTLITVGASLIGFVIGNMVQHIDEQDYPINIIPRVVISMFNHNNLMFTCVSTNDHLFYLSDVTNGVLLKVDYVWGSKNDSNAIEKVRNK